MSQGGRPHGGAENIQVAHGDLKPVPERSQKVLSGNLTIFKGNIGVVVGDDKLPAFDGHARGLGIDQNRREALRARLGIGFGKTTKTSAEQAAEINFFSPLRTKKAPFSWATVLILATSDPAPGSVTAKAGILSPRAKAVR